MLKYYGFAPANRVEYLTDGVMP